LAAALALSLLPCAYPLQASAQEDLQLAVTITQVEISGSGKDAKLAISADVTNTGTEPAYSPQAYLWRDTEPIASLAALEAAQLEPNPGRRMNPEEACAFIPEMPCNFRNLAAENEAILPGQTVSSTWTENLYGSPDATLGLSEATPAVFAVGLRIDATPDGSGINTRYNAGTATTFISLAGEAEAQITNLVYLYSEPSKLYENLFTDEHLAGELSGRLPGLVDEIGEQASFLIDPSLYDEIADMADGYQVLIDGKLKDGTGQEAAKRWLDAFHAKLGYGGARTFFASPDTLSFPDALETAATQVPEALASLPLIVRPPSGGVSEPILDSYRDLKLADGKVLNPAAVLASNVVQDYPTTLDGTMILSGQVSGGQDIASLQYELAAALLGNSGQLRVITEPEQAKQWQELNPGWLKHRSLSELLASNPTEPAKLSDWNQRPADDNTVRRVKAALSDIDRYSTLVSEEGKPTFAETQKGPFELRAASMYWQGNSQAKYLGALIDQIGLKSLDDKIELDTPEMWVMSSESNDFPITVTNNLPEPISVRIHAESENSSRLSVPDSALVRIEPGVSQTVNVRPVSKSGGAFTLEISALNDAGERVTKEVSVTVTVNNLSAVGWVIVIVSGVLLVALTWKRIRARKRETQAGSTGEDE
jgi:hypothetical protein